MRFLIQRCQKAAVHLQEDGCSVCLGEIGQGLVLLVGFSAQDTEATVQKLWEKVLQLRIFADADGKTNCDLASVGGSVLIVSQFTLYADLRRGRRPSFTQAAPPDQAKALYDYLLTLAQESAVPYQAGRFGADMAVSLVNDGPFTLWLDSEDLEAPRRAHGTQPSSPLS